jgi:hypothetical protein
MIMRGHGVLVVASGVALLAGCAGVPIVYNRYTSTYSFNEYAYAGSGGELYVEIHGNPTSLPQEEFNRRLFATLWGPPWGAGARYVAVPSGRSPYKIVLFFDPPPNASYPSLCTEAGKYPVLPAGSGGWTTVSAAFCRGPYAATAATAGFGGSTPDDPAFRRGIDQLLLTLFPPKDENRQDDSGSGRKT